MTVFSVVIRSRLCIVSRVTTKPISVTEAAAELGIGRRRVLALITAKRLPAVKVGQQFIIRPADLDKVRDRRPGRPPKVKPMVPATKKAKR